MWKKTGRVTRNTGKKRSGNMPGEIRVKVRSGTSAISEFPQKELYTILTTYITVHIYFIVAIKNDPLGDNYTVQLLPLLCYTT